MTPNHPNAKWLRSYYDGARTLLANRGGPNWDTVFAEHIRNITSKMSPNWVFHTAGIRLATTGDAEFAGIYSARVDQLCDGDFSINVGAIVADDDYACARITMHGRRGDQVLECEGVSAWRFQNGLAEEHWEVVPGPAWDDFFLGPNSSPDAPTGRSFWLQAGE